MNTELEPLGFVPPPKLPRGQRLAQWLKARMQQRLSYDRPLFYHGSAGLLIAGTLAMVLVALGMPTGLGALVDIGGFVSLNTVALYAAAQLCSVLLTLVFVPVPRLFAGFFLYVGFEAYFIFYYSEFGVLMAALFAVAYAICGAIAGMLLGQILRLRGRGLAIAGIIVAGVLFVNFAANQLRGASDDAAPAEGMDSRHSSADGATDMSLEDGAQIAFIDAENPALPGSYSYRAFTYGSGSDKQRGEYGEQTELLTSSVDASAYIKKWAWLKQKFWGFDQSELPLNARVWMPEGDGAFPLVLMVHGNHLMEEFSDAGYAYLGELLASRGFIAISVDENFLNYSVWSGIPEQDMKMRAWILLKHIQQIQSFSTMADNPFYSKVDFSKVSLIGHSRGGQAVAMAVDYKRWFAEDEGLSSMAQIDFASVVALAPTDKEVDKTSARLKDVSYLTLQGARDGDVNSFYGDRQYIRTSFTPGSPYFKASLYLSEANHSRFNSDWGMMDERVPGGLFLNQQHMMTQAEQQQAAKVYVSAFLEATLHGNDIYKPLFENNKASPDWLPTSSDYVSRYEDASFLAAARYEEDVNKLTLPSGGKLSAEGFKVWEESEAKDRDNRNKGSRGAVLEWDAAASYTLELAATYSEAIVSKGLETFSFSMENTGEEARDAAAAAPQIELELVPAQGQTVRLPLSSFNDIPLPFETQFTIVPWLEKRLKEGKYKESIESVFQTYSLPLARFAEAGSWPSGTKITRITFYFSGEPGRVMLDDIGFYK
ncbi:Alpha/beta hydrolase family protein [Paenibacillus algorifonticola]|uniref:Alpha/beta hydrolase family protein n=1 Tax=Paenibacillus algorifonticola TaxID=684063 RepID=A0A1I1ZUH5_9BACL|nr:hypothetical protein [Paenibacillus algorifonticola]SFE35316.1 Alpha/beta hydrolase family protein [Paenibacillus algorifonticola]